MKAELYDVIWTSGFELLKKFVGQPSVSLQQPRPVPDDIRAMQNLVWGELARCRPDGGGCVETQSYPVVVVPIKASEEDRPTLLLYNMADTRPVGDPSRWTVDPFGCEVVAGRMYGRGIQNSKSGLAGMLEVIRIMSEHDDLPVNLVVVVDAEEEVRPDSVREVVQRYPDWFANCQAAFMPLFCEQFGCTWLACKGVVVAKVRIKSSRRQVHSGMESVLRWPDLYENTFRFVESIKDDSEQQRWMFADVVFAPTEAELKLARAVGQQQTAGQFARACGVDVSDLRNTEEAEMLHREMARSHANVLGVQVGPCEGVVPNEAVVDIEFRFAPSVELEAADLDGMVKDYLREVAKAKLSSGCQAEVEILPGSGEGYRFAEADSSLVQALMSSYEAAGVNSPETAGVDLPLSISCFGSVPEGCTFVKGLGIPFMCGGVGRGGNFHVPNEWIVKNDYPRFKLWFAQFLHRFAEVYG